ncbi:hypothetical protein, partial [Accumulibacter sp.]
WDEPRMLILGAAEGFVAHGRQRTLSAWLDAPPAQRLGDPWSTYWRRIALRAFDPSAASGHLELAYHPLDATGTRDGYWLAWTANVELIRLAFRPAHDPSIEAVAGERLAVIEATLEGNTRISCSAARGCSTITR